MPLGVDTQTQTQIQTQTHIPMRKPKQFQATRCAHASFKNSKRKGRKEILKNMKRRQEEQQGQEVQAGVKRKPQLQMMLKLLVEHAMKGIIRVMQDLVVAIPDITQ